MTRPEEPIDDRTMPIPADPWPTVGPADPTVNFGDPDATVTVGSADRTTPLPPPAAATAYQPVTEPTLRARQETGPTVYQPVGEPTLRARQETGPTVYQPVGEPTLRAQRETRFGPGVPVAPVAVPAWPSTGMSARPRPIWRRLVSVVSGLLTLALVVLVGLLVWQRLSPLEVRTATVAVPRPAGNRCDVTVDVVATVLTNGRSGVIRYQWFRSDAPPGAILTERAGRGQKVVTLTLTWAFSGVGSTTETATVNIIEPSPIQAGTRVAYRCRG